MLDIINVLIIEDDTVLNDAVKFVLEQKGYNVFQADTGEKGIECFDNNIIDIVILDIQLPGMSGYDLAEKLKERKIPFIITSGRDLDIDVITGLKMGAEDYLRKPFNSEELEIRLSKVLERKKVENIFNSANKASVNFDPVNCKVILTNERRTISLTPIEFKILQTLYNHEKGFMSADELFSRVWKQKEYLNNEKLVRVNIRRLRKKIEPDPENPVYIVSKWGIGYCFNIPESL